MTEQAKTLVLSEFRNADETVVADVEGEAIVTLTLWPDDVRKKIKRA